MRPLVAAAVETWWAATYHELAQDLGLDVAQDRRAAWLLDALLDERRAARLGPADLHLPRDVLVAGAGADLAADLVRAPPRPGEVVVVADAALARVLAAGIKPALVVTDLDGDERLLAAASSADVPLAVAAHGDNVAALTRLVPLLAGPVLGTRQVPDAEPARLVMPGGFTDGDRAVFLAARLGAASIRLAGFDLAGPVAPGTRDPARKRRKLAWAARILQEAPRLGIGVVA